MLPTTKRRLFSLAISATLAFGMLTACSSGGSKSVSTGEAGGDLEIWVQDWSRDYNQIFDDAVAKYFTPSHPNIKLKITHLKVAEKLLPAVASGKVPDLTYISSNIAIPFAINGALTPLDDFMKANKFDAEADFSADINASYTWNRKLYGVGLAADTPAIFWNKDAFKDAGLDPEKPPKTLEEISQYNKKLLKTNSSGNLQRIGIDPTKMYLSLYSVGLASGSKFFDPSNNKASVNDSGMIKGLTWLTNEVKAIGVEKLEKLAGGWGTGNNDPFYTGQSAMIVDGFWRILDAKQFAPNLDYGVVPLPKSYAGTSWGLAIPTGAKNKKAAQEFIAWILTDKAAGKFMAEGTNPFNYKPGMEQWYKTLEELSLGTPNQNYIATWKDVFDKATENPYNNPAPAAYDQWLQQAMDDAIHGKKTPEEALNEANKQIQLEIDKALSSAK